MSGDLATGVFGHSNYAAHKASSREETNVDPPRDDGSRRHRRAVFAAAGIAGIIKQEFGVDLDPEKLRELLQGDEWEVLAGLAHVVHDGGKDP